jgi:hypothetical protein
MRDEPTLVQEHLPGPALEALASQRIDLVDDAARGHLAACAACQLRVSALQADSAQLRSALRVPFAAADLDALVHDALAHAHVHDAPVHDALAPSPALPATPSRRALAVAAVLGALAALTLGALSLDGLPSVGGLLTAAHELRALGLAVDRIVRAFVPGGWGMTGLLLSGLLLVLLVPLRALAAPRRGALGASVASTASLTLVLALALSSLAPAPRAHALEFVGDWPADERLTVVAEGEPASVALERAAQVAGLGFVGALAADPPTHLRVRNATLRDVVRAVLGADAPIIAERTATLLIVRNTPAAPTQTPVIPSATIPPTPSPSVAAPSPVRPLLSPSPGSPDPPNSPASAPATLALPALTTPAPSSHSAGADASDRVSFGGNVVVRAGEVVDSVVTMGGSALIEGEVLRDVVTMGGGVHVKRGGVVHGEVVAMGGAVQIDDGARVSSRVEFGPSKRGFLVPRAGGDDEDEADARDDDASGAASAAAAGLAEWLGELFASASRHALLFLFGLLLLGLAPARLDAVTRAVAAAPARAIATGMLSVLAAGVLGVVLVITIVGIPGAVVLALGCALGVYGGLVAVAAVIGKVLPIRALEGRPITQLAVGVLALFVASSVPIVGALAAFAAACIGLGAVVVTHAGARPL